ncbi:response regulator transcription factor [Myroides fluvii]|uniref:response regulator transcription factor n=1 Tax=Myroides fluvii TaxID=2572594 RepID=UPI00131E8C09|nr:response regulator transcription factor [Myroides fluvii]
MIRVGIVDSHTLFRTSFSLLLAELDEVEVVLQCSNGVTLLEALKSVQVDIVFLAIQLTSMDGYQVAGLVVKHHPWVKIVVLSRSFDVYSIKRMLHYNVAGYLTKNMAFSKLKRAILCVYKGGVYYDRRIRQVIERIEDLQTSPAIILSPREIEIIRLYAMQYNVKQIADLLHLSTRTIEKYKEKLMQKTGARNFIGVILFALRWHYIEDSELNPRRHD